MDPNFPTDADYASWGQRTGPEVDPTPAAMPRPKVLRGRFVELRSPTDEDLEDWWRAFGQSRETDSYWSYMLNGPYKGLPFPTGDAQGEASASLNGEEGAAQREARAKATFMKDCISKRDDPTYCYYAIVSLNAGAASTSEPRLSGRAQGVFCLFNSNLPNRTTELGHVMLAPSIRGTRAATEAFFLLMQRAFEGDTEEGEEKGEGRAISVGGQRRLTTFRRLEWKCNELNGPSQSAARRLGFTYEGIFRQHMINKARSRDTAWFSIIDSEWPLLRQAFQLWLAEDNFYPAEEGSNTQGRERQKVGLREIREKLVEQTGSVMK
ncbi:acyl-CoA N-acyltransferase [Microstroma glucosiphilum]|uniref:Acyl-CoA N-acyltransferase n=1 Tax=Pseudomicrostroma glucosiphilum TaxID=1684307 RepID=A0A316U7Z4_9BASI|nr:acyl-CoA N-acyltransferase [Pseudomicrostroma glucosiphilum]PWN20571.1 acyl-CoA N-acyltransferase [Pseudomicrostroma glucosiphilum]